MRTFKAVGLIILLVIAAFGIGYGLGYLKLKSAEKESAAVKNDLQAKLGAMERELARAKAREALREIPEALAQVATHIGEKNFGLAAKTLEGIKDTFVGIQSHLDEEMKKKFEFFLPTLEEIKRDTDSIKLEVKNKIEAAKSSLEQALKPSLKR
jgi:hypothetical protein